MDRGDSALIGTLHEPLRDGHEQPLKAVRVLGSEPRAHDARMQDGCRDAAAAQPSGHRAKRLTPARGAAIQQTRAPAATLRVDDTQDVGAEVVDVKEFELAIGHLRMPEMA